jgi:phage gp45-like
MKATFTQLTVQDFLGEMLADTSRRTCVGFLSVPEPGAEVVGTAESAFHS